MCVLKICTFLSKKEKPTNEIQLDGKNGLISQSNTSVSNNDSEDNALERMTGYDILFKGPSMGTGGKSVMQITFLSFDFSNYSLVFFVGL